MEWTNLAQERNKWQVLVNTVVNRQVGWNAENSFSAWKNYWLQEDCSMQLETWLVGWLVGWFVRSFVPSFVLSFVRCFVGSLVGWKVGWLVGSFVRSFVLSFVRSFFLRSVLRLVVWLVGWSVGQSVDDSLVIWSFGWLVSWSVSWSRNNVLGAKLLKLCDNSVDSLRKNLEGIERGLFNVGPSFRFRLESSKQDATDSAIVNLVLWCSH